MLDWDARVRLAQNGLAPALVLVGEWEGVGLAHGEPITASLAVRLVLGATQIEVWEQVGAHEDVCFYRFDVATGQLRVLHLMEPALVAEYPVEISSEGIV